MKTPRASVLLPLTLLLSGCAYLRPTAQPGPDEQDNRSVESSADHWQRRDTRDAAEKRFDEVNGPRK